MNKYTYLIINKKKSIDHNKTIWYQKQKQTFTRNKKTKYWKHEMKNKNKTNYV